MLGIGYFKGQPTEFVIRYRGGNVVAEGPGLTFYYLRHNTSIALVPTSSADSNFLFNEMTNNFQEVTIQGQFSYRIANPMQAASVLNFSIDPGRRHYLSNDPERLPQRIANVIQMQTRQEIQRRTLEQTLQQSESIAGEVLRLTRESGALDSTGVELLSVYIVSVKPTPEVGKALEAEYRETLLRKADEAIYARRAAAVAEERKIKENELNTDIALAQQRQQLIDLEGENALREADFRGRALEQEAQYRARASDLELGPYRTLSPQTILSLGLKGLGENAERIGNLTITSELLAALLNAPAPEE